MHTDNEGAADSNLMASNYEPLEGRGGGRHDTGSDPMPHNDNDSKNMVYFALVTAGIGFVLPYNSFIMAADYWQERFAGKSVALDMTMTYILVAFATVLLNNVFMTLVPYRIRVTAGYIVSFSTLIFVGVCEVAWHMFNAQTAYSVNLLAVSLVAIGCTIQQSSFYGFASMLPKKYPQAVMVGESLAGFLVSSNRVATKLMIENNRVSTMIFFLTSSFYIAVSYILHSVTVKSPFVRYHLKACAKIVLRPYDSQLEVDDVVPTSAAAQSRLTEAGHRQPEPRYGVLTLENSGSPTSSLHKHSSLDSMAPGQALSFSNPVYDLSNPSAAGNDSTADTFTTIPIKSNSEAAAGGRSSTTNDEGGLGHSSGVAFKVEHVLTPTGCSTGHCGSFRSGLEARWRVAHAIYPYMVCIALAYCVTLSLYPGLESEIRSCKLRSWMPVLLMFTFNTSDMVGKILAAVPYAWSRRQLTLMSGLRTLLIPLLLLCCTPRERPVISGEMPAFLFTAALGLSNGLAGSLPMMLAPAKVPSSLKEVAGNMMTLSYNVGLTIGSLLGYMFDSILGPQLKSNCPTFPYAPPPPMPPPALEINATVATTSTSAILSTLLLQPSTTTSSTTAATTVARNAISFVFNTTTQTPRLKLVTTAAHYLTSAVTTALATTAATTTSGVSSGGGRLFGGSGGGTTAIPLSNIILNGVVHNATQLIFNNSTAYELSDIPFINNNT